VNTLTWIYYGILTSTKLLTRVLLRSRTLRLRREPFREPQHSAASNIDPSIVDDDRFADPLLPAIGMAVIIWCKADSEIEKWARGSLPACGVLLPSCEIPETLHGRSPVICRRLFLNTTWENEQKKLQITEPLHSKAMIHLYNSVKIRLAETWATYSIDLLPFHHCVQGRVAGFVLPQEWRQGQVSPQPNYRSHPQEVPVADK
jgi:hypothetical protein